EREECFRFSCKRNPIEHLGFYPYWLLTEGRLIEIIRRANNSSANRLTPAPFAASFWFRGGRFWCLFQIVSAFQCVRNAARGSGTRAQSCGAVNIKVSFYGFEPSLEWKEHSVGRGVAEFEAGH